MTVSILNLPHCAVHFPPLYLMSFVLPLLAVAIRFPIIPMAFHDPRDRVDDIIPVNQVEGIDRVCIVSASGLGDQYELGLGILVVGRSPAVTHLGAGGQWLTHFLALFHHSFDYPVKTEGETIDQFGAYAGHLPLVGESHIRPDGYGLLDHQMLQSEPLSTTKAFRYHQPASLEVPPYVLLFPFNFFQLAFFGLRQ